VCEFSNYSYYYLHFISILCNCYYGHGCIGCMAVIEQDYVSFGILLSSFVPYSSDDASHQHRHTDTARHHTTPTTRAAAATLSRVATTHTRSTHRTSFGRLDVAYSITVAAIAHDGGGTPVTREVRADGIGSRLGQSAARLDKDHHSSFVKAFVHSANMHS
jgi:hypothetical protein